MQPLTHDLLRREPYAPASMDTDSLGLAHLVERFQSQIHRYHVAIPGSLLPRHSTAPLTWIMAANGIFLHAHNPTRAVLLQAETLQSTIPGLAPLRPAVQWVGVGHRLPGSILRSVLHHAQLARDDRDRPLEQQYWVVTRAGKLVLLRPPQHASATRVLTPRATVPVLLDIHSHHAMAARFSRLDDQDDAHQLGVSVVIGTIFSQPTLRVRLTAYGMTQEVPASLVFTDISPFHDHATECSYDSTVHALLLNDL